MFFQYFISCPPVLIWAVPFFLSVFLTILSGKRLIRFLYALKIGQPIRYEDCPTLHKLHEKKKETPTMGGVLLIISILIPLFLLGNIKTASFFLIVFVLVGLGILGGIDDYRKLKLPGAKGITSKQKFLGQVLIGLVVLILIECNRRGFFFTPLSFGSKTVLTSLLDSMFFSSLALKGIPLFILVPLFIGFFLFVFCGTSNAVNLTDGLDGLAAGNIAIVAGGLLAAFLMSSTLNQKEGINLVIALSCMAGSCIGFLWFNHFPAQIFMGDTGSLSLGGLLGLIALLMRREWLLALMGIIFVVEALSVIIQVLSFRYRNRKRVFLCSPIHHHFQYLGWHEVKIVTRFWIVSLIATLLGVCLEVWI